MVDVDLTAEINARRSFKLWLYVVSHSIAVVRTDSRNEDEGRCSILFSGVRRMELSTESFVPSRITMERCESYTENLPLSRTTFFEDERPAGCIVGFPPKILRDEKNEFGRTGAGIFYAGQLL